MPPLQAALIDRRALAVLVNNTVQGGYVGFFKADAARDARNQQLPTPPPQQQQQLMIGGFVAAAGRGKGGKLMVWQALWQQLETSVLLQWQVTGGS